MPKRTDLRRILLIGSGPIVIGQACEFDYSGTQGAKALREEGFEVVLVNSNPATIMTDPELATRTYIEPLTPEFVAKIIERERPQALLPTLGGQTALNIAVTLAEDGTLDRFGVELIGAKLPAIKKAEDRELFKRAMERIGLDCPRSGTARSVEEARRIVARIGYPAILRPSFTLGGSGGSIAYNPEELEDAVRWGLSTSPVGTVLVEESVIGWKEFELEVMRDLGDNVVIICSIENVDPMGIHTGDSITVAPAQTLSDKEYQLMRDAAIAIIREIGVETGGSNIQFAVNPADGRLVVIEMNPRVSRSSALASKATGFPIAKIAAKLAVGYTLDEIKNDITRETPACFEPVLDYCVVKFPRWAFEKFPEADPTLTTQMKSVGEVMAIGRTFKEALQKSIRSLEQDRWALTLGRAVSPDELRRLLSVPTPDRLFAVGDAYRAGFTTEGIHELTRIDPWFLENLREIVEFEGEIARAALTDPLVLRRAKQMGFADRRIAELTGGSEGTLGRLRLEQGIRATFKTVDTCAAEFEAYTPYLYATYEEEDEAPPTPRPKVVILGSGPNRIGQGIEFDYCCVHAAFALRDLGVEAIMVNCNPETVSTDYDTSDRLYFEPLTLEDVLNVVEKERPLGVIVQFGGQTPLKLAVPLRDCGGADPRHLARRHRLRGGPPAVQRAPDRTRPEPGRRGHRALAGGGARHRRRHRLPGAGAALVRPGRAGHAARPRRSGPRRVHARGGHRLPRAPGPHRQVPGGLAGDRRRRGGRRRVRGGGRRHGARREGGHPLRRRGLRAAPLFPRRRPGPGPARADEGAGPRASTWWASSTCSSPSATTPSTSWRSTPAPPGRCPSSPRSSGCPLAKIATRAMLGHSIADVADVEERELPHIAVKEAVFPFIKFPGVDMVLGPEMKSTGEVMGIDVDFRQAYLKSQIAADSPIPASGKVFISVKNRDKRLPGAAGQAPGGHGVLPGGYRRYRAGPRAARHGGRSKSTRWPRATGPTCSTS